LIVKSGVSVSPLASSWSSVPPNDPCDASVPEMPLNTPRSAFLEIEVAVERRIARFVAVPRAEPARHLDFTRRHAIGERRLERPRMGRPEVVH
jgi:hypothetical protein